MMKKASTILICMLMLLSAVFTPSATTGKGPRVLDEGALLTFDECEFLTERLDKISEKYTCDVVIVTTFSLDGMNAEEYSDYIYQIGLYGQGNNDDCIMLLVSTEYNDWALTPYGDASDIFTTSKQDGMVSNFKPFLSDGDFYGAFEAFADDCEEIFETHGKIQVKPLWIGAAVIIGIIIAFIVVFIMKSQLKTVRFQPAASNYLKEGSLNITQSRDIFLYSTVTRTPKPKNTSSSGGSGVAGPRQSGKF